MDENDIITILLITSLVVLCTIPQAHASYNSWYSYRGSYTLNSNPDGYAADNYTNIITSGFSGTGQPIDAVVDDMNSDGVNEVIMDGSPGTIALYEGNNMNTQVQSLSLGTQKTNPVFCDVNNDGRREFVTVTEYNNSYHIFVLTYNGTLNVLAHKTTYNISDYFSQSNLLCFSLYAAHGDSKNYVWFVDNNKYLHKVSLSGTTITDTSLDIEGSTTKRNTQVHVWGDSHIVASVTFDEERSISWASGAYMITYYGDGESAALNINLTPNFVPSQGINFLGDVPLGGTQTGILIYDSSGGAAKMIRSSNAFFTGHSLDVVWSKATRNLESSVAWAVGKFDSTSTKKLVEYFNRGDTTPPTLYFTYPNNGTQYNTFTLSGLWSPSVGYRQAGATVYATKISGSTDSVIFNTGNVGVNPAGVFVVYGPDYNTSKNLFNLSAIDSRAPIPVDVDTDGIMDLIYTGNSSTKFAVSGGISVTEGTTFNVIVNTSYYAGHGYTTQNTTDYRSRQEITMENSGGLFNGYGVVCNYNHSTIFSNVMIPGYNITLNGITDYSTAGTAILTSSGLWLNATGVGSFDVRKSSGANSVVDTDSFELDVTYISQGVGNAFDQMDIIALNENNAPISWITIYKNLTERHINITSGVSSTWSAMEYNATGPIVKLKMLYTKIYNSTSNKYYYAINITDENTNDKGFGYTSGVSKAGINGVDFYSNVYPTSQIYLQEIELSVTSEENPPLIYFMNGQEEHHFYVLNITMILPVIAFNIYEASVSDAAKYGDVTIIPSDIDDSKFSSICSYNTPGYKTQKHCIGTACVTTWANISAIYTVNSSSAGGNVGSGGANSGNPIIDDLANNLGTTSANAMFILWMIVTLIAVIALGIYVHPIVSVVVFGASMIVGTVIDWVPIWVTIVLVIFDAAAVVLVARNTLFDGSSGGE